MQAGRLRHRVTIKYKATTQNALGEEVILWTELDTVWASVEPLRGREYMDSRQAQADVDTRVRIRYQEGITVRPSQRVYFGDRVFEIVSVIDVWERNREMQLMCREHIEEGGASGSS